MAGEREGPMGRPTIEQRSGLLPSFKNRAIVTGVGTLALLAARDVYTDQDTRGVLVGQLAKDAATVFVLGSGRGMVGVAGITKRHHRELTHRSLTLAEVMQKVIDFEQLSYGVTEANTWASVHRIHHQMTDTSLFPFYRIYHAVNEARNRGISVEETSTFKFLDPSVKKFDLKTVMDIGESADKLVKERMGKWYRPLHFENDEAIKATLNPTEPQYWYPEYPRKNSRGEYTHDEIARILLTDPHSPVLIRRENGVQGVALSNVNLYQRAADLFRHYPEFKPIDLQRKEDFDPKYPAKIKRKKQLAIAAGFVVPSAAMFGKNADFSVRGLKRAALMGAAINGIGAATEIFGGNVTNSAGHMGDPIQTELAQAFLNRIYEIKLKPDGTYATNTIGKGPVGRLASWATLDEVGGQQIHHEKPWKIKYTDAEGRQAIIEAPWGSLLEYLAKNEHFSLINEGEGFEGPRSERPDVVHPSVKAIQNARAAQYAQMLAAGEIKGHDTLAGTSGGLTRLATTIRHIFPL